MHPPLVVDGHPLHLARWPVRRDDPLRAWDTADQLLLQAAGEADAGRVLVVEDAFGALAVPLARQSVEVVSWADSHLCRLALEHNLGGTGLAAGAVAFVPAAAAPGGVFDTVLARFPKSLALWHALLLGLRDHVHAGTRILSGGMIKHTPRRAYELLELVVGPTRTGLGWKKARIAHTTPALDREPPALGSDPGYELPGTGLTVRSGPGVFARERLDGGTRALLAHLPRGRRGRLADLGCGNGALALALATGNPDAEVLGVDTSSLAIASARANAASAGLEPPRVQFTVADGLDGLASGTLDLVACNPPFHQDRSTGDALAWGMFTQARRTLVPGGGLLVVGNRHLDHGRRLARIFGGVEVVERRGKYEVLRARRR
jgi:16S rRNA (guanine1207-N2)-methyltransferase